MVLPPAILPLPGTALRVLSLLIPTTQKALRGAVGAIMMAFRPSHVLGQRHNANPFQSIYCASLARLSTRVFVLKERSMMATYSLFCLSLPSFYTLSYLPPTRATHVPIIPLYMSLSFQTPVSFTFSYSFSLFSPWSPPPSVSSPHVPMFPSPFALFSPFFTPLPSP